MKERNKTIFRIMLFASVGILLAQTVLLAVLGNDREMRIVLPVIIFFSELITGGMIAFFTLNPQYNRNYTFHRRDGRWRWERITYGPDPNGMRYISAGVGALMIALLFAVISSSVLWPQVVNEIVIVIAVVVLLLAFCAIYYIIENKLRKQL
jgi:peptidoglycan/LPS O-acetylase OafA/YrhL